jgi:RNA polymerase sigma factor FliA
MSLKLNLDSKASLGKTKTWQAATEETALAEKLLRQRHALVTDNLNLVKQIANKLSYVKSPDMDEDDLIAYGIVGLVEAAEKYEEVKGASFKAFAALRIRGAILDQMRAADKLSRGARKKVKTLSGCIESLEAELGKAPSDNQLAKKMNLPLKELYAIQRDASMVTLSLNVNLCDESEETLLDLISDSKPTPYDDCERNNFYENLVAAVDALPEREKLVVGLYHNRCYTMKQIAKTINTSESRACQIHNRAISLLKSKLQKFID